MVGGPVHALRRGKGVRDTEKERWRQRASGSASSRSLKVSHGCSRCTAPPLPASLKDRVARSVLFLQALGIFLSFFALRGPRAPLAFPPLSSSLLHTQDSACVHGGSSGGWILKGGWAAANHGTLYIYRNPFPPISCCTHAAISYACPLSPPPSSSYPFTLFVHMFLIKTTPLTWLVRPFLPPCRAAVRGGLTPRPRAPRPRSASPCTPWRPRRARPPRT